MVAIPFIFFSIILAVLLRDRRRFDLASYVALLYAGMSFFAIMIDVFGLRYRDVVNHDISFESAFVYCTLLGIFLIPIVRFTKNTDECMVPVINQTLLKTLSVISFLFFLITLIGSFDSLVGVFQGDMRVLRHAVYANEMEPVWFSALPFGLKQIVVFGNMLFANFWVQQFLSFYCLLIQKIERKYAFFYFAASLLGPIWGILSIDRSKVTYWIIALIANYFLFNKYMTKKQRNAFVFLASICICFLTIYLSMMTDARFGERSYGGGVSGSLGGVISYLGQSFIEFSFFYDSFINYDSTLSVIFPLTHKFVFGEFGTAVSVQEFLTRTYNMMFGVFYTFLGQILVSAGKLVMFVYAIVMSLIGFSFFNPEKRKNKDIFLLYLFMVYSSIMFLGLFGHYYANYMGILSLVLWAIMFQLMLIRSH